jgi:glycosyltransferase involved in cell wall biosynthesis
MAPYRDYLNYARANGAQCPLVLVPPAALIHADHFRDPAERGGTGRAGSRPVIACIGRLIATKRPDEVLQVFAKIAPMHPNAHLVFFGDGELGEELASSASAMGLGDRVEFAGAVSQPELARRLCDVTLVISPITGWALVEAALAERPIVAYDLDWQSDFIVDGVTGRLVPAGDVHAAAQVTHELLTDPEEGARLGRAARRHALATMDPAAATQAERQGFELLGIGRGERAAA